MSVRRRIWLAIGALLVASNCASPALSDHPEPPLSSNAPAAPSVHQRPSAGPDDSAVTFYQVSNDDQIEPVWLGKHTVLRHRRDGQALAELHGDRFVIDPKLAAGLERCSASPAWTFYGQFPDRAFALADLVPHSKLDRGPLLRWNGTQWALVRLLTAHDVLASLVGDELLVLRDRVTTSPAGTEYAFDYTAATGAIDRPFSRPPRALITDDKRVLVLGLNEKGDFQTEQWRGAPGVGAHSPLTPAPAEISAFADRGQGNIWLAAVDASGAAYLVHGTDAGWQGRESLPARVVSMVLRPAGDLWLIAETPGGSNLLRRASNGQVESIHLDQSVGAPRKLWLSQSGDVWLAANGLYSTRPVSNPLSWIPAACEPKAPAPELRKVLELPCVEPFADAEARAKREFGRHAKLDFPAPLNFQDFDHDGVADTRVPIRLSPTSVVDALYHYDAGCSRFLGLIFAYSKAWGPQRAGHDPALEPEVPKTSKFDNVSAGTGCAEFCCSETMLTAYQFDGLQYRRVSTRPQYTNCTGTDLY